jgi:hypothetical protein
VATILEAAVLAENWERAEQALGRLVIIDSPSWQRSSTINNLEIIREVRSRRGLEADPLTRSSHG